MMGALKVLMKRPTDKTIRTSEFIFGLIYIVVVYYNLVIQGDAIENTYFWMEVSDENITYVKHFFVSIWFIPLIKWGLWLNLLKSKYLRFSQILFGIILFYIGGKIVEWPNLDVDALIVFMWLFPLFAWITGKLITKTWLKHGQKITKIRV